MLANSHGDSPGLVVPATSRTGQPAQRARVHL